jgi:peptidoglycan/xylan/chitin deacetylase (PgdA/CDA1 family)
MPQASINIDLDTLSEDLDGHTRIIRSESLRAITYRRVLPRFLDLLARHDVRATFFVIGRDAVEHGDVLRSIAAAGHELANHTMNHPKQLVHLDAAAIAREIEDCGRVLERLTGEPVLGFRAPGYTVSVAVIDALRRAGYLYDTSLNPSLCYYLIKSVFKAVRLKDKAYLSTQRFPELFAPHSPYRVAADRLEREDDREAFVEIPISLVPGLGYPFVTSMLLHFGRRPTLHALSMLVARGRFVNCELHINEFTDRGDLDGDTRGFYLTRQYARIELADRMRYFDALIAAVKRSCDVVLMRDVALVRDVAPRRKVAV